MNMMTRSELEAKIHELEQALTNMEHAPLPLHVRNVGIQNFTRKIKELEKQIRELRD